MRKLFVISAVTTAMLSLPTQLAFAQADPATRNVTAAKRDGPLQGPIPRLPDGSVNLYDGVWTRGGPTQDLEGQGGMEEGELVALLLPWAKTLMDSRGRDHGAAQHLPADGRAARDAVSVPVRRELHAQGCYPQVHPHRGEHHTYRQIFMDGREHPSFSTRPGWGTRSDTGKATRS